MVCTSAHWLRPAPFLLCLIDILEPASWLTCNTYEISDFKLLLSVTALPHTKQITSYTLTHDPHQTDHIYIHTRTHVQKHIHAHTHHTHSYFDMWHTLFDKWPYLISHFSLAHLQQNFHYDTWHALFDRWSFKNSSVIYDSYWLIDDTLLISFSILILMPFRMTLWFFNYQSSHLWGWMLDVRSTFICIGG